MIVTVANPVRDVDASTFADLTSAAVTSVVWGDAGLLIDFNGALTVAEQQRVKLRCVTRSASDETLMLSAYQALQANDDFLANAAPTQAQSLAQIKALTRQVSGLIRVALAGAQ